MGNSKHILVLLKFHPERELRLIQEFCKDGNTYDVIAPSFRIAADWNHMIQQGVFQPAQKVLILPELVKGLKRSGNYAQGKPAISTEIYEKAIVVDKHLSKLGSSSKTDFFLNCYLHIIDNELNLSQYSKIIGEISSAFELLLYQKAQVMGICFAYFIASPITSNTFFFINDKYEIRHLPEIYHQEKSGIGLASDGQEQHQEQGQMPGYMQFNNQTNIKNLIRSNQLIQGRRDRLLNFIKTYWADSQFAADFVPGLSFYLGRLARWYRFFVLKMTGKFLWQKSIDDNHYVLFLQYEPEITTTLYAYPFKSQKEWIETVLAHLEEGKLLYIKEHPAMFSQRNMFFYLFLRKQKQVRLVDPSVSSKILIQNARAVLTLNSTVGIESLKTGTPVISFGNAYFNFLPEVFKWQDIKARVGWKNWGELVFPSPSKLKESYELLERSIKKIEYEGCLNDHRVDSTVMTSENMRRVKNAIEQYVG